MQPLIYQDNQEILIFVINCVLKTGKIQQKTPQTKLSFFGSMPIHIVSSELNTFQVEGQIQILVLKGIMLSNWLVLCLLHQVMIRIIKIPARLRTINSNIPFTKKKKSKHKSQKDKIYIYFITAPSIRVWYKKQLTTSGFSQDMGVWNSCVNEHFVYMQ